MRIAVLGATGVVGRHVAAVARERGHDVVACSRAAGVDLATSEGLASALEGCAAAIDVTNVTTMRRARAFQYFESAARNLQSAAATSDVPHLLVLSIVGVSVLRRVGYYDAKLAQERLLLNGAVPATVLRATQFHEFPGTLLARMAVGPVALIPRMRVQTIAARSVAERLVDLAGEGPHRGRRPDLGGPGPTASMAGLARAVLAATRDRRRVVEVPFPGAGRAVAAGALLPAEDADLVGPTFVEWLEGPDGPGQRAQAGG
jgi:uncharacterized protein YbjT (DUF2867 family)